MPQSAENSSHKINQPIFSVVNGSLPKIRFYSMLEHFHERADEMTKYYLASDWRYSHITSNTCGIKLPFTEINISHDSEVTNSKSQPFLKGTSQKFSPLLTLPNR